jgi:DNA-binding NarL/FixJ family response regulator
VEEPEFVLLFLWRFKVLEDVSVLLVDDHTIVRQGFRKLLEEGGVKVVGEASDGREGINRARELRPDIIVMDIKLPHLNGIEATRKICDELPSTRVIMLTVHLDELYVFRSLDAGARGYLVKETAAEDLLNAIEKVMGGEIYLSDNFPSDLLDN